MESASQSPRHVSCEEEKRHDRWHPRNPCGRPKPGMSHDREANTDNADPERTLHPVLIHPTATFHHGFFSQQKVVTLTPKSITINRPTTAGVYQKPPIAIPYPAPRHNACFWSASLFA
jgi:hypothetical protein